jgi:hypothetical protein
LLFLAVAAAVALGGCGLLKQEPELNPQEVVTKFYRWYIGYPGNPLVDKAYRDSPHLAESFVEEVDEALAGGFRADPILLAQDIPERFTVEEMETSGDQAKVMVYLYWSGNETPAERIVDLELIAGEWRITNVSMEL